MAEEFYWGLTKKYITIFGSLFDSITITKEDDKTIKVPIAFSSRQKFLTYYTTRQDLTETALQTTLPRMGFELASAPTFDPSRASNPMNKIQPCQNQNNYVLNRVPYNFNFSLYIISLQLEDCLKIVEQIFPIFTPAYNILIKEFPECDQSTDIPIVLSGSSFDIDYEGGFENRRFVTWQFDFVLKGHFYNSIMTRERIERIQVNVEQRLSKEMLFELTPEDLYEPDYGLNFESP